MGVSYGDHSFDLPLVSGTTSSVVDVFFAQDIGLPISPVTPLTPSAEQYGSGSVVGEVHCTIMRNDKALYFDAIVVEHLNMYILAGCSFMEVNNISLRPAKCQIIVDDNEIVLYPPSNNMDISATTLLKHNSSRPQSASQNITAFPSGSQSCGTHAGPIVLSNTVTDRYSHQSSVPSYVPSRPPSIGNTAKSRQVHALSSPSDKHETDYESSYSHKSLLSSEDSNEELLSVLFSDSSYNCADGTVTVEHASPTIPHVPDERMSDLKAEVTSSFPNRLEDISAAISDTDTLHASPAVENSITEVCSIQVSLRNNDNFASQHIASSELLCLSDPVAYSHTNVVNSGYRDSVGSHNTWEDNVDTAEEVPMSDGRIHVPSSTPRSTLLPRFVNRLGFSAAFHRNQSIRRMLITHYTPGSLCSPSCHELVPVFQEAAAQLSNQGTSLHSPHQAPTIVNLPDHTAYTDINATASMNSCAALSYGEESSLYGNDELLVVDHSDPRNISSRGVHINDMMWTDGVCRSNTASQDGCTTRQEGNKSNHDGSVWKLTHRCVQNEMTCRKGVCDSVIDSQDQSESKQEENENHGVGLKLGIEEASVDTASLSAKLHNIQNSGNEVYQAHTPNASSVKPLSVILMCTGETHAHGCKTYSTFPYSICMICIVRGTSSFLTDTCYKSLTTFTAGLTAQKTSHVHDVCKGPFITITHIKGGQQQEPHLGRPPELLVIITRTQRAHLCRPSDVTNVRVGQGTPSLRPSLCIYGS